MFRVVTWATLALVAGVDVKVVSEHVVKGMQSDAAEKVAALIFDP
jgi:hypothetical protein